MDKQEYINALNKIRDSVPLSWHEISRELDMPYGSLLRLVRGECTGELRPLTARKIKGLMNKYKSETI
jgi:hypothetical protein